MQSRTKQKIEQNSTQEAEVPVAQRLKQIAKFYGLSIRGFERECKLTAGYIGSIRQSVGKQMLDRIVERYPELDPLWILFGDGEMLRKQDSGESVPKVMMDRAVWEEMQKITETVNSQQRVIAAQAESIRHQADSLFLLLKDAKIEGLTVAKSSPNEPQND